MCLTRNQTSDLSVHEMMINQQESHLPELLDFTLDQGLGNESHGPDLACCLDLYGSCARNEFYIFKWLKNIKRIFCDVKIT